MGSGVDEDPPRDDAATAKIVARFAPWWGFVVYGVLWAFLAGTVVTVLVGIVIQHFQEHDPEADPFDLGLWGLCWAISYAIVTPLFTWWAVHRRRYVVRLAREGTLVRAKVLSRRRRWVVAFLLRLGGRAQKTQLVAMAEGFGTYRVAVPAVHPSADTESIRLIAHVEMRQALALAQDDVPAIARR